jgi:hypothetical protein
MVTVPTRGDTILDIYMLKPESSFISCRAVPGISGHNGVLLEAVGAKNRHRAQDERIVPLYPKTDVLGLQAFLREKYSINYGLGMAAALKRFGLTSRT